MFDAGFKVETENQIKIAEIDKENKKLKNVIETLKATVRHSPIIAYKTTMLSVDLKYLMVLTLEIP